MSLSFVAPMIKDGKSVAHLNVDDVQTGTEKWVNALLANKSQFSYQPQDYTIRIAKASVYDLEHLNGRVSKPTLSSFAANLTPKNTRSNILKQWKQQPLDTYRLP